MNKYASIRATNASAAQTNHAPVDVLAVIRSRANRTDNNGLPVTDETLLEASDAVDELIEAAHAAQKRLMSIDRKLLEESGAEYECELGEVVRLDAALARVQGGAK